MSLGEDGASIPNIAELTLSTISEIIKSVDCIAVEQETFAEIGCYLYRTSLVIMELQATGNGDIPENATDILHSLSVELNVAKFLLNKCGIHNSKSDSEMRSTIQQLEEVVRHMGEYLSLIPSPTFQEQEYFEVAIQSLSNEMQKVSFKVAALEAQEEETEQQISFTEDEHNEEAETMESDLYSVNVELSTDNSMVLNMPYLIELFKEKSLSSSQSKQDFRSRSPSALQQTLEYAEPLYEAFYCPLTKHIMDDPVTLESGVTFERSSITQWFESFKNSDEIFCPITGQKLLTRVLRTNVALKTTMEEWKARNEAAKIKVIRAALSVASSSNMVFEAIRDLQTICARKQYNKVQVLNAGILPLLGRSLEYNDRDVRCAALEVLGQLAEEEDGKEMIAKMVDISMVVDMLSSGYPPTRHAALLLILELSRSEDLSRKIGSVPGGILMLIRIKYNHSVDALSSKIADETLRNLESFPENIKHMAENGFLEPLLNHLIEGSEEIQMEMASYLGEITLRSDSNMYVAEKASPALIEMVHKGNTLSRSSAFKALAQISSHSSNAKTLLKAGIIQVMAEEIFIRRIYSEPMNSKAEATAILANIFETGLELENLQVNTHGHKLSSDYVLYNIIDMIKNSTPDELNLNLVRILLCLTKSSKSVETIFSLIKETEASYTLIELINNPHEQLAVATIKLLIELSPHMGNMLVERLCKTRGQPENLLLCQTTAQITERQAVSAKFLAKLPHQNLTLNLALARKNTVPVILQMINQIQATGTRMSRYASSYLESLVGILVQFTTTLYQPEILSLARDYHLTLVFTELLMKTSSDEVQRLSAIGLENLSSESVNLSRPAQIKKSKSWKQGLPKFLPFSSSKKIKVLVCPVHRGTCSSQNTFCLVDARAVERLLACLDHENAEVVEAALSAICTLLDDKVDVDNSVGLLSQANAIRHILNVVKEHREEGLWQKSFWVLERFLMKGGDESVSDISQDKLLPATLISAFHHGNGNTRQMAENVLRLLKKVPSFHNSNCII